MVREHRGGSAIVAALLRTLALFGAVLALAGCASGIAAGVTAVIVTLGFVSRTCYDHVSIKVFDGATGHRTCSALVEVGDGEGFTALESCYHAELPEGRWTVRASLADRVTETADVVVPERRGCPRAVHTMDITLKPAVPYLPPPYAPAPGPPAPAPAQPAPLAPLPQTPALGADVADGGSTDSPPAGSAEPSPAAPPVQRFPEAP